RVDETTVEMCKLHLYPEFKGQGLGKYLALALIEYAKGLSYIKVNLHVTQTQKEAIGLYKRLGFCAYQQKLCEVERNGKVLKFDTLYMERSVENESLEVCV
ncbi:MAG: GNAT family N-acetyltransferase, partial [Sulfurovaceae bacterium]|nr:GNAT family N-acetyltransferase [Sulfurovaceae bacterium]